MSRPIPSSDLILGARALLLGVLLAGCSTRHYQNSADLEVYNAIAGKAPAVPNMDPAFTITETNVLDLASYPTNRAAPDFFGPMADLEVGARVLTLRDALEVAVHHNRRYQNEKESLYLQALSLTLSRHRFAPIFSAGAGVDYAERRVEQRDEITGAVDLITERNVDISARGGVDVLLRSGGRIAAAFTTDFLRYLIGDRTLPTSSALVGTVSQPLLRGAGYRVTMENLTQAERNLLYSLRAFTRFRKEFTVDIVSEYYRVLQDRDRVRNAWQAYQNFQVNVRRENARYEEGLARKADLAELQESELTNEQSWINALRTYRENLDRLKISLGLTTDTPLVLDDGELARLQIDETHLGLNVNQAIEIAFASRLDLHTVSNRVEDADRRIAVAANAFLPQLDLVASGRIDGAPDRTSPDLDLDRYVWSAGLDLELPLDRKQERNAYRAALIDLERARRELENSTDDVRLQIQNGWRNLEQAKREYEISRIRVELSLSRVREQELLNEIGEGDAFELVRAQDALTGSRNQLTSALINHTLVRLGFWRDLGLLTITANGQWSDIDYGQDELNF